MVRVHSAPLTSRTYWTIGQAKSPSEDTIHHNTMQAFNDFLLFLDQFLGSSPWFAYLLLGTGLFFTLYLRFPQVRFFGHAIRITKGTYDKSGQIGDTSPFQALTTALSGTVGTGNIAGVAYAIHLGGPAALFWMLVTATVGTATKMVEVTLAQKYREQSSDGSVAGGPMYYMKNAEFRFLGRRVRMMPVAAVFAGATIVCSLGTGNLPQINSIAYAVHSSTGISNWITGLLLSILLALVIIGGIKRIAAVTSKLVPTMSIFYVIGALSIIFINYEEIIPGLRAMVEEAFTGSAAVGGFMGATIAFAFQKGVGRGLFSNEAGQGSAPIAHAAARSEEPLSEGMVAILEPFIDTIVICMITGLALLASGVWKEKHNTRFQETELVILDRLYNESNTEDRKQLFCYLNRCSDPSIEAVDTFNGTLDVEEGHIQNEVSLLHARALAEGVLIKQLNDSLYSGALKVRAGKIEEASSYIIEGKSLIHSAPLTMEAFKSSIFGNYGHHIVTIGLLLFAFSTAISWSYYGDRATIFLFGPKAVLIYRICFVAAFFIGSFTDTKVVWNFANVAIVVMTIPNLVCILWLRREMPRLIKAYGAYFKKNYPGKRHPRFD